jgi:lipopolysaccharide export system permease protein
MIKKISRYIFFELIPPFVLGLLVFIFILLMFQALRLTDFVLVHGVGLEVIGQIVVYLSISFLPAILPMSLLFAIIMTYGRLSSDSEVVAIKASGYSMVTILSPALLLSLIIAFFSAHTSFVLAPWGNRQFELIVTKVGQTKAGVSLKEGTFSEGFFDLVLYANEVDSKTGTLEKVFIYDERNGETPLTIIAKRGNLIQDIQNPGHSVLLRLFEGDIHRKAENHTKINIGSFDIRLLDPIKEETREKTPLSMSLDEVLEKRKRAEVGSEDHRVLSVEYHKRMALSVICPLFAMLGVGLATTSNRRNQKSNGLILSLGIVIFYWIVYVALETLARNGSLPVAFAIWLPNFLFFIFSIYSLKKNWN